MLAKGFSRAGEGGVCRSWICISWVQAESVSTRKTPTPSRTCQGRYFDDMAMPAGDCLPHPEWSGCHGRVGAAPEHRQAPPALRRHSPSTQAAAQVAPLPVVLFAVVIPCCFSFQNAAPDCAQFIQALAGASSRRVSLPNHPNILAMPVNGPPSGKWARGLSVLLVGPAK